MGIWLEDWRGLPIEVTALSAVVNLLRGAAKASSSLPLGLRRRQIKIEADNMTNMTTALTPGGKPWPALVTGLGLRQEVPAGKHPSIRAVVNPKS